VLQLRSSDDPFSRSDPWADAQWLNSAAAIAAQNSAAAIAAQDSAAAIAAQEAGSVPQLSIHALLAFRIFFDVADRVLDGFRRLPEASQFPGVHQV